jgi:AcrR family transcriptional regulator
MSSPRTEATADEIRRVALEMFASRGYASTSVRDLTRAVGIRESSMYNHFGSKEAVLWDLTRTALDRLFDGWAAAEEELAAPSPGERLAAFVRAGVRHHAVHNREATVVNAQLASLSPEHFEEAVRRRTDYENLLRDIVGECLATGEHEVPDLRLTTYAILQMSSAVAGWYRPDGDLTVESVCDTYAELALKMVAVASLGR